MRTSATLSCSEPGAHIGPPAPHPSIDEAHYGPLMMFKAGWFLDPLFPAQHSDNDLIMRHYLKGERAYRNNASKCFHLNGVTWSTEYDAKERAAVTQKAYDNFEKRYGNCPLHIYKIMQRGMITYGQETL
jgi:hypothetical protein